MKRTIRQILKATFITIILAVIIFGSYLFIVANSAKLDLSKLQKQDTTLLLFDKEGNEIDYTKYDNSVKYEDLPKNLINAFVCTEDKKFFEHNGVDFGRILKASIKNLANFSFTKEGASTITQQLIKNTQLTTDKTLTRKAQEIKLALELEKIYSKEEILTAYFNVLYFGNSIYGVNNAAKRFFGKSYTELSLSECATLAGVVKSPANYSPLRNMEKSIERRNYILSEMEKDGYITNLECNEAKNEKILLSSNTSYGESFINEVIFEATQILGISEKELAYGGYRIYTQYDMELQKNIENYFLDETNLAKTKNGNFADSVGLVCDNKKTLVNAYYGSYNTNIANFLRQPGSTIKPFVSYLPLLSTGEITPATPIEDKQRNYDGYSPKNYGNKYVGWTNMRYGIANSVNSIAVENLNNVGILSAINYAEKYGYKFSEKDYSLSIALGGMTDGVTISDVASSYMALANNGYYKKIGFVEYITKQNGQKVYKNTQNESKKIENAETTYLMTDMLYECVKTGTASRLNNDLYKIASKTGTVSNVYNTKFNNDIWNVSYTSAHTVCVWMGNVSNSEDTALLNECRAGIYPTEGAKQIYDYIYSKGSYPKDIEKPDSIISLPFSKEEYLMEHNLIVANEFYTKDEVLMDIFNKNLLKVAVDENLPKIDLSLDVKIKAGLPNIMIKTQKGVEYEIKKSSLFENEDVIEVFLGDGNTRVCIDNQVIDGNDYEYRIDAYITNFLGERKLIKRSNNYLVSIPYNFWI